MLRYEFLEFRLFQRKLTQTKGEQRMKESEKIKRELHDFWLKQLDQRKDNGAHSQKDPSFQQPSPLALDAFFQRQPERSSRQHAVKRAANGSVIESPGIIFDEKQVAARPVAAPNLIESNHHASATDKLRQWFGQNFAAEPLVGRFYVKAVDLLSLQQAEQDWNHSTSNGYEASHSLPYGLAIDDRLMWLAAPSS